MCSTVENHENHVLLLCFFSPVNEVTCFLLSAHSRYIQLYNFLWWDDSSFGQGYSLVLCEHIFLMVIVALGLRAIVSIGIINNNLCTAENCHWAALHSHITNKASINVNVFWKKVLWKKNKRNVKCRYTKRQLFNTGHNYVIFHYALYIWCFLA